MENQLLMTPGPTIVPEKILDAMAKPVIHHRTPEFVSIFQNCSERLQKVFKTQNGVYIFAGTGTAAMEASICNTISPGDKVLSIVSGKFSERLRDIAKTYGANVTSLEFEWGSEIKLDRIKEALTEDTKLVTSVHNETSTGVRNPIQKIGALLKDTDTLFMVDAISSLAGDKFETDDWDVDLCISGSQKCMALPTGLSFISVSEDAWGVIEQNKNPHYYLDLQKYRKKYPQTPFSTPVSLIFALEAGLDLIDEEGFEKKLARHHKVANYARNKSKELGFELFPEKEEICSNTLSSFKQVPGIDTGELIKRLNSDFNIRIAGGQAHLKGKIFRIAHMGIIGEKELDVTFDAIQDLINKLK